MPSGNKKTDDNEIIGLNSVGLSLGSIGKRLNVHHTTITARLKVLNIEPADTRRAFMEEIYDGLSAPQQEWLIEKLSTGQNIQDFIGFLIKKEYSSRNQ